MVTFQRTGSFRTAINRGDPDKDTSNNGFECFGYCKLIANIVYFKSVSNPGILLFFDRWVSARK